MNKDLPNFSIPARVYVQVLSPIHPLPGPATVQNRYGALSNFFGSLARTAKHIIFPNLVKLGRNVVSDINGNKGTLLDSAGSRTMETLQTVGIQLQKSAGKRRRRRHRKKAPGDKKLKAVRKKQRRKQRKRSSKPRNTNLKRGRRKRRTKKRMHLPLSLLMKRN